MKPGQPDDRWMVTYSRESLASICVTFNAHILETGTDSYRLRTTRTRTRRKTA